MALKEPILKVKETIEAIKSDVSSTRDALGEALSSMRVKPIRRRIERRINSVRKRREETRKAKT